MSEKTKEEGPNENAIRWILNILLIFFIVYMISTCSEDSSTSSTESQPQTIENRFPNVPNLEQESIISKDISEDMLLTMIQIVKLHGKLTKITKHAKRHFWLNDVCTCHGLLPSHSA